MCFGQCTWADKETVVIPGLCAELFTTRPVFLFDTLTLSHRAQKPGRLQDGEDNEEERVSLWHTHTQIHNVTYPLPIKSHPCVWHSVNQRADFISPPDAGPVIACSSTCTVAVQFLKQCKNDTRTNTHITTSWTKMSLHLIFFFPVSSISMSLTLSLFFCFFSEMWYSSNIPF